jgi:ADP-heptose:LPS heptosyltransferase
MPRCLVIHPGALGDVLLAGPALAHLRQLGFRTTLAAASRLVGLFARSGLVDAARDLEGLLLHRLFVEPPDPAALGTVAGYDAIVSWLGAGEPAFGASLGRVGCPVVVARAAPPAGARRHVSRHLLETLAPLGPPPPEMPPARLDVADGDRQEAEAWLGVRGLHPAETVILQPGAGSAAKAWPGFASLARRLRDTGVPVVALAGPADGFAVERLVGSGGSGALTEDRLARDWPLARVAALLSRARAAVGNDSGPTHLAAAVGCPTVALFGPTDPAVWAPIGRHVRVLSGGSPDAPWTGVTVDRVEAALRALLAGRATSTRRGPARAPAEAAWP